MEKRCIYKGKYDHCELLPTTNYCVEGPCPRETFAYWMPSKEGAYCSECGKMALMTVFDEEKLSNYCPNCGVPMSGVFEVE